MIYALIFILGFVSGFFIGILTFFIYLRKKLKEFENISKINFEKIIKDLEKFKKEKER